MEKPFKKIGFIGLIVLVFSIILLIILPTKAPSMPDGFNTPIIAFEFLRTKEEVYGLFGPMNSEIQKKLVASMDLGNRLDFIYMLLYSTFLFLFSFKCTEETGNKLFYSGMAISVIVLFGDFMENIQLLGITSKLATANFETELFYLNIYTWIKWLGIALVFLILFIYFIKGNIFSKIIGIFGIISFLLGVSAFLKRGALNELLSISVALMFVLMIIYCFIYKKSTASRI